MTPDVWVLTDHRRGTAIQAIALAESMGLPYTVKDLRYNIFGRVPNCILGGTLLHVKRSASSDLSGPLPKIIISSGRRAASVAVALKKTHPSTKIIQIMKPFLNSRFFDLIILPQHDAFDHEDKVVRIIGSLHNIEHRLDDGIRIISEDHPNLKNFISVVIGGSTKQYAFSAEDAEAFAKILSNVNINHGIPLFISFSRRTPQNVKNIISEFFTWPHIIYDPVTSNQRNPYYGMLALGSFIISTCDSISMCSEATASGKPLYIFCPEGGNMQKHRYFVQQLVDLGVARLLVPETHTLTHYSYSAFNEAQKVAKYIKEHVI